MAKVEGDEHVWEIVTSRYPFAHDPNIKKRGATWVVKFAVGILDEKREMHIKDKDAKVVYDSRVE